MANSYQFDQFSTAINRQYYLDRINDLDYQQSSSTQQIESTTYDYGRLPYTSIIGRPPSIFTDLMDSGQSTELEFEHSMNEFSETCIPFSYDCGEFGTTYGEVDLDRIQADIFSPSQPPWTVQNDSMWDSTIFQDMLPENFNDTTMVLGGFDYTTANLNPPSNLYNQNNNLYESDEVNRLSLVNQSPRNAAHICEFCSKVFSKRYLLNDHKKIHNPDVRCPFCPKRTVKPRDMKRHIAVHHRVCAAARGIPILPRSLCPVANCKMARRGFARKDHLRRHLESAHPSRLK